MRRGENAFNSGHVLRVHFEPGNGSLSGKIQASMKDKAYDVKVSHLPLDVQCQPFLTHCLCKMFIQLVLNSSTFTLKVCIALCQFILQ